MAKRGGKASATMDVIAPALKSILFLATQRGCAKSSPRVFDLEPSIERQLELGDRVVQGFTAYKSRIRTSESRNVLHSPGHYCV